jgi:hypothetical protein
LQWDQNRSQGLKPCKIYYVDYMRLQNYTKISKDNNKQMLNRIWDQHIFTGTYLHMGLDSLVCIATGYGLDSPRIESR